MLVSLSDVSSLDEHQVALRANVESKHCLNKKIIIIIKINKSKNLVTSRN